LDYQSRKATQDAPVIERMKALAAQYPRFGYRRIGSASSAACAASAVRHLPPAGSSIEFAPIGSTIQSRSLAPRSSRTRSRR
jgi:hypothetical protein